MPRMPSMGYGLYSFGVEDYTYGYDAKGRMTNMTSVTDGWSHDFTYDNDDQLLSGLGGSYSYDANGNRTNTGYTTDVGNRLTSDGTYDYTYDSQGNRVARSPVGVSVSLNPNTGTYDPTSDGSAETYQYDARNRLVAVITRTDSGGTVITSLSFPLLDGSPQSHMSWVGKELEKRSLKDSNLQPSVP